MNWDTFVPDLIVAVAGALLAVAIAVATFLIGAKRREREAIQSLIDQAHERRALSKPSRVRNILLASRRGEFHRVVASVLSLRGEVNRVRGLVRVKPPLQNPLAHMALSCNQFLEVVEKNPESYLILAAELRRDLAEDISRLVEARRGLVFREPGEGALDDSDD